MKEYHENEGDENAFGSTTSKDLLNLKLNCNSFGGHDTCVNKFEKKCFALEGAHQELTESQKRTVFLEGVIDNDCKMSKEVCRGITSFKELKAYLRQTAVELGKE